MEDLENLPTKQLLPPAGTTCGTHIYTVNTFADINTFADVKAYKSQSGKRRKERGCVMGACPYHTVTITQHLHLDYLNTCNHHPQKRKEGKMTKGTLPVLYVTYRYHDLFWVNTPQLRL